jgi:galactonate dehydratase
MKITEVQPIVCQGGIRNWTFVKISTDEGITGWGDATEWIRVQGHVQAIETLSPLIIGENPFNIERLWQKLYRASYVTGKDCNVALSGIETALWDIMGKALNTPVYNLLGGKCYEKVRLYVDYCDAYQEGFLGTNTWNKGDASLAGIAKQAQLFKDQHFTALKFHPVGLPQRPAISRIASSTAILQTEEKTKVIREAVGPEIDIMIDINNRLDVPSSIRLAKALEPYHLLFLEDPIRQDESPQSYRRIQEATSTPIGTGENLYNVWSFRNYLEIGALDAVLLDVVHCGGILQAKKIAALAEAYHVPVSPHNPNSPLSTIISGHFLISIPNSGVLEYFAKEKEPGWIDTIMSPPLTVEHGYLELPDGPGWGVDLNEEEIAKHPYKETWYSGLQTMWEGFSVA